jgi:tetratricopeptide (TPR) repeat protein
LTEDEFEFEPVGALTLKGKAEPVPAWRLVGGRKTRAKPPVGALVGRQRELAEIIDALGRVEQGAGTVVAVTGEPGIGKSRLTGAVERHAIDRGIRWLHGRCLSYGAGLAYWPYADVLRRWAGISGTAGAADAGASLAGALDRSESSAALPFFAQLLGVTPAGVEAPPDLEPEAFRRALHRAFAEWLRALAAERPVVLALEDVHWIDASSLELTRELAQLVGDAPLAIYLLARTEARDWLDELTRDGLTMPLEPLSEAGIQELIAATLGGAPPAGLAAFVARRTAGNPLFVQELLRSLLDGGAIEHEDGRWQMRPGWDARTLPATVEEVLSARIDMLARPAAALLQTAAVIGRRVPLPLLEAVAEDASGIELLVGELVTRGFLEQHEDNLAFHHALIQDAAYERLLRRRRQELHRRVAEAAEALYGAGDDTVDLLARHLYLGGGGPKAVEYLRRAGERSKRLFANEEAILHLSRAGELAPDDTEVRLALADLHELVGDYDDALRLYEQVRGERANEVRAWAGAASTLRKRGEYEPALAIVDEAFRNPALRDAELAPLWLEQGWTLSVAGRYDQAIDVFLAGLELLTPGQNSLEDKFLLNLSRAEMLEGRLDNALEHGLEAERRAAERDDLGGLAAATRVLGDTYRLLGRLPDAAATLRRGLEIAERIGSTEEVGGCLINLGLVELSLGNVDAALACNERAIETFEAIGHGSGRATAYSNQGWTLANAGRYEEALEACAKALELARLIGNKVTVAQTIDTVAFVALKQEDFSEAAARAEEAARLFLEMKMRAEAQEALDRAAEAWENDGDDERALAVRTRARSLALAEA